MSLTDTDTTAEWVADSGGGSSVTVQGAVGTNLGATATVDFASTEQEIWLVGTLDANLTVTLENRVAGCVCRLLAVQNGTGGYTVTISDGTNTQAVAVNPTAGAFSQVLCDCPDATNITASPLSVPGPQGATGNTGATGATGATDATGATGASGVSAGLQNGILKSTDLGISSISINSSTGALSFTLASAPSGLFVNSSGGVLTSVSFAGGAETPSASVPASGKYAVVGVEIDTSGAITVVKGTDTSATLNTGSLIASNSPATSRGKLRLWDFAVFNNSGTYEFGNSSLRDAGHELDRPSPVGTRSVLLDRSQRQR